jgi:hypothetical protein
MTITVELPDSPLLDAAIRFDSCNSGYRSVEDWAAMTLISVLESSEPSGSPLARICEQWHDDLHKRYEQAA